MRLRAAVQQVTGATKHLEGRIARSGPVIEKQLGPAASVEIQYRDGGYFLLYFDAANDCFGDSWHSSLEEAKAQAKFEFGIEERDWEDLGLAGSA